MRDRSKSVKAGSDARQPAKGASRPSGHPVDDVPAEGTNVLFDVWLVSRGTTGLLDAALARTGLTGDEFGIYSVLTSAEVLTPSELARWMSAPATTVSSYVKRFEKRGHVVREPNPDDGRSYLIRLTAAGHRAHRRAGAAFLPVLDRVVAALGSDEPSIRTALGTLRDALDSQR